MLKNFAILLVLLVGIGIAVNLANNPQVFFSQAAFKPIEILQQGCVKLQNGKLVSTCDNISLKLSYLWEGASPSPTPTAPPGSISPTPTPNATPIDTDGDGVPDPQDCAPTDKTKWQIKKLYRDEDMDRFTFGAAQDVCVGNTTPDGWRDYDSKATAVKLKDYQYEQLTGGLREYDVVAEDCYDKNRLAFPRPVPLPGGEAGFYGKDRGDGRFDYDCDGVDRNYQDFAARGINAPNTYHYGGTANNYVTTIFLPSTDPLNQVNQQTNNKSCSGGSCVSGVCGVSLSLGIMLCN